jgi:hypothetical protein
MEEKPILKDQDRIPDQEVLREALKERMALYEDLMDALAAVPFGLSHEWRYYKDGHAWLCKVTDRKKTILWLSVFDGFFKVAFYFSARTGEGVARLPIDDSIRDRFEKAAFIGKVKPLIIHVLESSHVKDALQVAAYKKKN